MTTVVSLLQRFFGNRVVIYNLYGNFQDHFKRFGSNILTGLKKTYISKACVLYTRKGIMLKITLTLLASQSDCF